MISRHAPPTSLKTRYAHTQDWLRFAEVESEMVTAFCSNKEVNHQVNQVS